MERFDGSPEDKKAVLGLLTEMGYAVEGGGSGISQLQHDVKELGQEAFMESIPKDVAFRTRANLSRFVKALMLGEADPSDPVSTVVRAPPAEKDETFHIMLHNIMKGDEYRKLTLRVIYASRFVDYELQSRHHAKLVLPKGSSLQLMCQTSEKVRFHRAFSAKDLSVIKGYMILAHSWLRDSYWVAVKGLKLSYRNGYI